MQVKLMQGCMALELKKEKKDKQAKRLIEFCEKASNLKYKLPEYANLREQYKDVL